MKYTIRNQVFTACLYCLSGQMLALRATGHVLDPRPSHSKHTKDLKKKNGTNNFLFGVQHYEDSAFFPQVSVITSMDTI